MKTDLQNIQHIKWCVCELLLTIFKFRLSSLSCCQCLQCAGSPLSLSPICCFPTSGWSLTSSTLQSHLLSTGAQLCSCPRRCSLMNVFVCVCACVKDKDCVRAPACVFYIFCECESWRVCAWQAVGCAIVLSLRLCLIAMHQRPCHWCLLMGFRFNFYIIM